MDRETPDYQHLIIFGPRSATAAGNTQNRYRMDVKIEESWKQVLKEEFDKPYFANIVQHLKTERSQGKIIYPPGSLIFNAFETTPFKNVKVVILGQDPYHGPGQAHGLCFSVPDGVPPPPSLVNIFKEIHDDLGATRSATPSL